MNNFVNHILPYIYIQTNLISSIQLNVYIQTNKLILVKLFNNKKKQILKTD